MSASHRSLARLPLDVFSNLVSRTNEDHIDPETLRNLICTKLKQSDSGTKFGAKRSVTTVGELLRLSKPALLRAVDPVLTYEECLKLVERICVLCAPTPCTALSLLQKTSRCPTDDSSAMPTLQAESKGMRHLRTGMPGLDECLRGGFRIGTITEIVGRAGAGKTQLAMQLCVEAARHGQGSVYIDTEKKISLRRLKEIAEERAATFNPGMSEGSVSVQEGEFCYDENEILLGVQQRRESQNNRAELHLPYKSAEAVLENITIHSPASTNDLLFVVASIEEEILIRNQEAAESSSDGHARQKLRVGLIVLDSIAAPTRRDFGAESAPQRVSALFQVAQILKRLADQLQVAVVAVNQVGLSGNISGQHQAILDIGTNSTGSDLVAVTAALGTSWHHCVATRLLLEHERDPHRLNTSVDDAHEKSTDANSAKQGGNEAWKFARGHVRTATVMKSNVTGMSSMTYEVTATGLSEIDYRGGYS